LDFKTPEDGILGFLHASNGIYCREIVNVSEIKA
jgi:hypothetical protein